MRRLNSIQISYIPPTPTKDDPLGERSYLTWSAIVEDKDRSRKYGEVLLLGGKDMRLDDLSVFLQGMDGHLRKILKQTPSEVTASEAA